MEQCKRRAWFVGDESDASGIYLLQLTGQWVFSLHAILPWTETFEYGPDRFTGSVCPGEFGGGRFCKKPHQTLIMTIDPLKILDTFNCVSFVIHFLLILTKINHMAHTLLKSPYEPLIIVFRVRK